MQDLMNDLVVTVLLPALLMLIGFVIQQAGAAFTKYTGIKIDKTLSDKLHEAIERYVRSRMPAFDDYMTIDATEIDIDDILSGGATYARMMNPDAVKRFKLDDVKLRELVKGHMQGV